MSVRKLTASLLTALVLLGGVASVGAQEYAPVADPFAFDPDFQWFEPVYDMDLADMKPNKRAHNGWFGTYDRMNMYFSRPETDEPDIAEVALAMFNSGDWVAPRRMGVVWVDYPPMIYWAANVSAHTTSSMRSPPATPRPTTPRITTGRVSIRVGPISPPFRSA